jgi:hypothetical protein
MDNFNIKLNSLKTNLINIINQSKLPVGVVYYLLKDILIEVEKTYNQSLFIEQQVESINKSIENDNNDKKE